jgi:hypothetical protein
MKHVSSRDQFSHLQQHSPWATVCTEPWMKGGALTVRCSRLTPSGRNGAPHVSSFAERSSASFNSQAAAVGTRGTVGAIGTPGAVGILDRVW